MPPLHSCMKSATVVGCRPRQAAAQEGRQGQLVAVKQNMLWAVQSSKAALQAICRHRLVREQELQHKYSAEGLQNRA